MTETTTDAATAPGHQAGQVVPAPRANQAHAAAQLVPTRGSDAGAHLVLTGITTIGRGRDCDLVLEDPTISRHHAELHQHPRRHYTLTDTGSLHGLYLNRHPTQHAELADGDEIWIGKARFTFHLPTD